MKEIFFFIFLFYLILPHYSELICSINIIRHGARTPLKYWSLFKKYFPLIQHSDITFNGFQQEFLLGQFLRNKYLKDKLISINNLDQQVGFIVSPYTRTVHSAIAISSGLFPKAIYKVIDKNTENSKEIAFPPIFSQDIDKYKMIITSIHNDVLFHGRKCKFPKAILKNKELNENFLNEIEYKIISSWIKNVLPGFNSTINENLIKSLYNAIRSLNFRYNTPIIHIPNNIDLIFRKLLVNYAYKKNIINDDFLKVMSSDFFVKISNILQNRVKHKLIKEITLFDETFRDLKFLAFVGHDYNIIGIIKNLVDPNLIEQYLENYQKQECFEFLMPGFSSIIEIQLHFYNNNHYVKIFYNGNESFKKLRNNLNYNTEKGIELKDFLNLIDSRIFKEYNRCQISEKKFKNK